MYTISTRLLLFFASVLVVWSCQTSAPGIDGAPVINLNDSTSVYSDSAAASPVNLQKAWRAVNGKLPTLAMPASLNCATIKDSVQFELSAEQQSTLIPKELLAQKDPLVAALYNLVLDKDTIGTFYRIYYPVVYDELNDITNQIVLVLYAKNGSYSDYKTLAINDYGTGYSRIKSPQEIRYRYSAESEFIETDITVFDVSDKVSIRKVNTMHFSSRGNQEEYEKNNVLMEKLMR